MMFQTFVNFACLAAEANLVISLRLHRICLGGISARNESMLMVSEKVKTSRDAFFHVAAGYQPDRQPGSRPDPICFNDAEDTPMRQRRFSSRQHQNGTWSILDGLYPAAFTFHGKLNDLTEDRAILLVEVMNTLELRRTARRAAIMHASTTQH